MRKSSKRKKEKKEGMDGRKGDGREKGQEKRLHFAAGALRSQRGLAWHKRGYQLHPWLPIATKMYTHLNFTESKASEC
jgi:hypothetical protein